MSYELIHNAKACKESLPNPNPLGGPRPFEGEKRRCNECGRRWKLPGDRYWRQTFWSWIGFRATPPTTESMR